MPVKSQIRRSRHVAHKKERHTKHFMKVYAPYLPLLLIVGCGIFLSSRSELRSTQTSVKSYAINTTDEGLLDATNKARAQEGLAPLRLNKKLDTAAETKAADMKAKNYWSHVTPEGIQPWAFIDNADYTYKKAAENLAFGFETSKSTVTGWMNSPGHRANVMDPELKEVGFGISNVPDYQGHGPETIVVAMYGDPVVDPATAVQLPVTGSPQVASASEPKTISFIQSLTAGKAPWSSFAVGLVIGSIIMYLIVSHARSLRLTLKESQRFVIKHPLFDVTLIALLALAAIVSQEVGTIY